jgi:hypothetical protein
VKATPLSERIPTVLGAQKSDDAFSSSSSSVQPAQHHRQRLVNVHLYIQYLPEALLNRGQRH